MGLIDRLRRAAHGTTIGPTLADIDRVRRALHMEAQRRGSPTGLSMTQLLEHSTEPLRQIDIYAVIAHLAAEGELTKLQQPSDGNMRFDLTGKLTRNVERDS